MNKKDALLLALVTTGACVGLRCSLPPDPPPSETGSPDSTMTTAACSLIAERVDANHAGFYVFENADSGFNHGFPSGFFGSAPSTLAKLGIEAACLDDPDSTDGCSSDAGRLDRERGTVLRVTFAPLLFGEYVGINIEEPENWGGSPRGNGYNLTGATAIVFDVRSPTLGGMWVQFGMGGRVWSYTHIAQSSTYTTMRLQLDALRNSGTELISPPDLGDVHLLFSIATNDVHAPLGGTVLIDNIRFEPVPGDRGSSIGFPLANETFGVAYRRTAAPGRVPFPLAQVRANIIPPDQAPLTAVAWRNSPAQPPPAVRSIADALVYVLENDNAGLPLPVAADGSTGLHNAYSSGDLALFNDQGAGAGQQGDVRLAGFTAGPEMCGDNGYCLVLDGATGGNNAFAMLALVAAYEQFHDTRYLDAARTIGRWIIGNLSDASGSGYGGFYLGYADGGVSPKILIKSKSTENNADLFSALTRMATIERALGNHVEVEKWSRHAEAAAMFVLNMYDLEQGRFYAGTVLAGTLAGPGIDPTGPRQGDDVINVFDFLDSNTFSTLALASAYQDAIDWRRPVQYVLDRFAQSVTAGGPEFRGFSIVVPPTSGPNGVAWEFTGQAVVAMRWVDALYGESRFEQTAAFYLDQIRQARQAAPFGDGRGVVAGTLQDGDTLPPIEQCLSTPFQCIPERVGLAATAWAVFAEQNVNPLATEPVTSE